jgi:hypothetical protein
MRTDVAAETPIRQEDLRLIYIDRAYIYDHKDEIAGLWERLMIERHSR